LVGLGHDLHQALFLHANFKFSPLIGNAPLPIHFLVARKFLKGKHSIEEPEAVDILARKIVEHCCNIQKFKIFNHQVFSKNPIDLEDLGKHFEDESGKALFIDMEFIKYISGLGLGSKKIAKEIKGKSEELYDYYKKNNYPQEFRPTLLRCCMNKKQKEYPTYSSVNALPDVMVCPVLTSY